MQRLPLRFGDNAHWNGRARVTDGCLEYGCREWTRACVYRAELSIFLCFAFRRMEQQPSLNSKTKVVSEKPRFQP